MKKLILAAFAVFALTFTNAQGGDFGLLGGLTILSPDIDGLDADSETGFLVGAFVELGLSDNFAIQPELTYSMAGDISMLNINAIAKIGVADGFDIHVGPKLGFAGGDDIDDIDELLGDDFTKTNFQIAAGVGYDFTENFFAQARYGFQINDHFTGDGDGGIKINTLDVTLGYRF